MVLGLAVAMLPTRASASELNLLGMGAHSIVTIDGDVSGSFYAGEIDWKWAAPTPDGFEDYLYTYCVDILNEVASPEEVRISDTTDPTMVTSATDGGDKAAWLLNNYASAIHAAGNDIAAAALQVAIWEAITDNALDLTGGSFILRTTGEYTGVAVATQIFNTASGYLADLSKADYHNSVAIWLDATLATGGGQDQIATPEPSSLLLLGVAGLFIRRRKLNA